MAADDPDYSYENFDDYDSFDLEFGEMEVY